ASDRLPDPGTPEQQYALQYLGRQAPGLGGDDDRLAELVIDDAARLSPRDGEHVFELTDERLGIVLQRGRFQPPDIGSLHGREGLRWDERCVVEIDQDQSTFGRFCCVEQLRQLASLDHTRALRSTAGSCRSNLRMSAAARFGSGRLELGRPRTPRTLY